MIPNVKTDRLALRTFLETDAEAAEQLLMDAGWANMSKPLSDRLAHQRRYLAWGQENDFFHKSMSQFPYGDRAIVLQKTAEFIGIIGLVPVAVPLGQLPSQGGQLNSRSSAEVGLYWSVLAAHRGRGYATEAAAGLIQYMFETFDLNRIIATTSRDNAASQQVMRKLGMRVEENPFERPEWFQVVGMIENKH